MPTFWSPKKKIFKIKNVRQTNYFSQVSFEPLVKAGFGQALAEFSISAALGTPHGQLYAASTVPPTTPSRRFLKSNLQEVVRHACTFADAAGLAESTLWVENKESSRCTNMKYHWYSYSFSSTRTLFWSRLPRLLLNKTRSTSILRTSRQWLGTDFIVC